MPRLKKVLAGYTHSAQCVALKDDGTFYVDLHDFNPESDSDYAWTVYVMTADVPILRAKLEARVNRWIASPEDLLDSLAATFATSRGVAEWIESEAVPFENRSDPWAALDADEGP
jgi:hypothetical protein